MSDSRAHPPRPGTVDLGDLAGTEPVSRAFGGDRGTPLDRHYIGSFLERHAADIGGRVLEIGENLYTRQFGGDRVARSDVLDVPGSGNEGATIEADLAVGTGVPQDAFDCIVLVQTLHMIFDVWGAVRTVRRALKPGGVVLATIPGITAIDAQDGPEKWFWAMTQTAARRLFAEVFGEEEVTAEQSGNVLAATAFLQGLAFEELDPAALAVVDPLYPVLTGIRARRAP